MFPVLQSPCVFEPLPMVNMFGGDQLAFSPEPKRRRAVEGSCRHGRNLPRKSSIALRFTVTEAPEGYVLSLYKKLPKGMLFQAVNQKLSDIKEKSYTPTYHIVHDMFGTPYYLEEEVDQDQLLRDALSKLDMKGINRKLARELFQDYEIELNHRGDELSVSSRKDDVSKAFEIGECIDDVQVIGCRLDEAQEYGILKIGLVKRSGNNVRSADLAKLIEWSQSAANEQEEEQRRIRTEEQRALEAKAQAEAAKAKAAYEAKAQAEAHAAVARKIEEQKAKSQAEAAAAVARKIEEQKAKSQAEAEAAVARKIEEQKAKDAKREERRRKKDEKIQRKIAEEKREHLKQKKSFLIEQQRAKRLRDEKMSSADSSPNTVTININFGDDGTTLHKTQEEDGHHLRRCSSPVLEEVDDAEFSRFHESLNRSPRGSSVIEDM